MTLLLDTHVWFWALESPDVSADERIRAYPYVMSMDARR